jgi:hypothetical protein
MVAFYHALHVTAQIALREAPRSIVGLAAREHGSVAFRSW